MGSPGGYASRMIVSPPEKGSFPLDHFLECQTTVDAYKTCLSEHNNAAAYCHSLAKAYLQCRMDHGLMAKENLDNLGFAKDPVPPGPVPGAPAAPQSEIIVASAYGEDFSRPYVAGLSKVRRQ